MQHQRDDESKASDQNSPESAASTYAWSICRTVPPTASHDMSSSNFDWFNRTDADSSFTTRDEFDEKFSGLRCVVTQAIARGAKSEDVDVGVFRADVGFAWEDYLDGGALIVEFQSHARIAQGKGNINNLWYAMLLAMIDNNLSFSNNIVALVLHIGQETNPVVTIEVWLEKLKGDAESSMAEIRKLVHRYRAQIRSRPIRYEPFSIRFQKQSEAMHEYLNREIEALEHENQRQHSEKEALRSDLANEQTILSFFQRSNAKLTQYASNNARNSTKLQSEMDTLRSERNKLLAAKVMNDKHNTMRNAKINKLEKENQKLRLELEKANRDADRLKNEKAYLMHVHQAKVHHIVADGRHRIYQLDAKNKELQAELDALKQSHYLETIDMKAKKERAQKVCLRVMDENEELRSEIAELKKKLSGQ